MRCYFMRKGHIAAVEILSPGPDELVIEEANAHFQRRAADSFDGFEVWDCARRLYVHSKKENDPRIAIQNPPSRQASGN